MLKSLHVQWHGQLGMNVKSVRARPRMAAAVQLQMLNQAQARAWADAQEVLSFFSNRGRINGAVMLVWGVGAFLPT